MIKQNGNGKSGAKIAGMTARVSCFPDGMSAGNVAMVTPRNQVLGRNMFKEVIQVKKVVSVLLAAGIIATTGAFAENVGVSSPAASPVASPVAGAVSSIIDFADGNFGFLGMDTTLGNADASELSVVDYNGGKALCVSPAAAGRVPYVSLNVEGLLGENLSRLAKITFDVGVELGTDGKFYAQSGKVYMVNGEDSSKQSADWSVYMERKNPKTAVVTVPAGAFVAGRGDTLQFSKEVDSFIDSKKFDGEAPRDFYVTNIQFFDAEGNVLPVDTTAEWVAPVTEEDRSYLYDVANAVEFPNFAYEGGGWSQNGAEMPQEFLDALVPGSVIEISYESEDGTMWIVLPDAAAGWSRVANDGSAAINSSKNTCQITYEQIAAVCGEDKSTWGARLQCEAGSAWKVYSVKVGQKVARKVATPVASFDGFSCEGGAWSQNGFDIPENVLDALVPGTALQIDFESEDGSMWIVMPDCTAGWMRVAQGAASISGGKAYITYEQIVEACGEDKAGWGARMQCEAESAWKVYAVSVVKLAEMVGSHNNVEFEGAACEGGAWGQNGTEMPENIVAALVPGAVINISYESETGNIWIVLPDAAAGWSRVQQQTAATDGKTALEMIASHCPDLLLLERDRKGDFPAGMAAYVQFAGALGIQTLAVGVPAETVLRGLNDAQCAYYTPAPGLRTEGRSLYMEKELTDLLSERSVASLAGFN